jgi:hypothetical protein
MHWGLKAGELFEESPSPIGCEVNVNTSPFDERAAMVSSQLLSFVMF